MNNMNFFENFMSNATVTKFRKSVSYVKRYVHYRFMISFCFCRRMLQFVEYTR